jgi:hypothetical protein
MALSVLAYNLTRVMNIVGIKPLMAAIAAWDRTGPGFSPTSPGNAVFTRPRPIADPKRRPFWVRKEKLIAGIVCIQIAVIPGGVATKIDADASILRWCRSPESIGPHAWAGAAATAKTAK